MSFRSILMAIMLFFASATLVPSAAYAQAQPAPTPAAQPSQGGIVQGVINYTLGDDDRADGSKKNFEAWKSYFMTGDSWCWGCRLFQATGTATLELGKRGTDIFAGPAASSVAAFMGLWVMWQLYLMLSISHANSPAQSIDTIFNRLVIMTVVLILLKNNPYEWVMKPFLDTLGAVMSASSQLLSGGAARYGTCNAESMGSAGQAWIAQGNVLLCGMQKEMGGGLAIGAFLMDSADFSLLRGHFDLFQWSMGLLIFAVFGFMIVILPFKFFDALVRIAIVSAIVPLAILAYLFKPTRGFVKQAVTSLLAAMLTFLFTAIAIAVAVSVLHTVTADIYAQKLDSQAHTWFGPLSASDFMVLLTAALGMASMISSAGTVAAEFAGFQGQMGNAGAGGAGAITGAANLAAKGGGAAGGMMMVSNRVGAAAAGAIKAGKAG